MLPPRSSAVIPRNLRMTQQVRRYRMQIDLRRRGLSGPQLPPGYRWVPWRRLLLERHALVKWRAFRGDLDGQVFPCLSKADGCRRLMQEITAQPTFCANATWLLVYQPETDWPAEDCASIQGIARRGQVGAIQNVGVVPEHRGLGLGRALVQQALQGFRFSGLLYGFLEVTAENRPAVKLYESLGFEIIEELLRDLETGSPVSELALNQLTPPIRHSAGGSDSSRL